MFEGISSLVLPTSYYCRPRPPGPPESLQIGWFEPTDARCRSRVEERCVYGWGWLSSRRQAMRNSQLAALAPFMVGRSESKSSQSTQGASRVTLTAEERKGNGMWWKEWCFNAVLCWDVSPPSLVRWALLLQIVLPFQKGLLQTQTIHSAWGIPSAKVLTLAPFLLLHHHYCSTRRQFIQYSSTPLLSSPSSSLLFQVVAVVF